MSNKKSQKNLSMGNVLKFMKSKMAVSLNMIIVIIIVIMIPNTSVMYQIILDFLATYDGCSLQTVKPRRNKMAAIYISKVPSFDMDVHCTISQVSK